MKDKLRLKNILDVKLYFWTWDCKLGYSSVYYDGWNNQINLGIICICWLTPQMLGDE